MKKIYLILSLLPLFSQAGDFSYWKADYVPGRETYALTLLPDNKFVLTIDPNQCSFDTLGNIEGCTKIMFIVVEGEKTLVPIPTDRMTLVYKLGDQNLELVDNTLERAKGNVRLLKIDPKTNRVIDSIRLLREIWK